MNAVLLKLAARCTVDNSMNDRVRYEVTHKDLILYSDCSDMMVHSFDLCANGEVILYVDGGECVEFKTSNDPRIAAGLSLWVRTAI